MRRGVVSTVNLYRGVDDATLQPEPADQGLVLGLSERADEKVRRFLDVQAPAA
jgi:hypothetical protein